MTPEHTRADTITEVADALEQHALRMNDDYAAAPWCRCADFVRHLQPVHTDLTSIFLDAHPGTSAGEQGVIDDLQRRPWISVRRFLRERRERRRIR